MKYLLFDQNAIYELISKQQYQSFDFSLGHRLVEHICGNGESEIIDNLAIEHTEDGVIFTGKRQVSGQAKHRIYCFDLTVCNILSEKDNGATLLYVFQKSFRTAIKIWEKKPFSSSEHIHETKSILFPFPYPDRRRLVIERSNTIQRLISRGIDYPLLAYKYNAEDAPQGNENVNTNILREAGEHYVALYNSIQLKFSNRKEDAETPSIPAMQHIVVKEAVEGDGFVYYSPDIQYKSLTEIQKNIVDNDIITAPLRIEGAAGTGKTISLLLRAYNLLEKKEKSDSAFSVIFITHSESTNKRCREIFELYPKASKYLKQESSQNIVFTTLLDFCRNFARIDSNLVIERDAEDAKTYQLMLIENVLDNSFKSGKYKTYKPLLSEQMISLFSDETLPRTVLVTMLQHEFSVQIKGRTNGMIEEYYDLPPITNGIPCSNRRDKEFIHSIFTDYQNNLQYLQSFDVDDVVLEALSRLNAPVWRRERNNSGFDYIIVDEMHLFNINEQSVFHYLARNASQTAVPICFALDNNQAIGDRGQESKDYIETAFGHHVEKKRLNTVFRNSPQIAEFCASIAASGTLMFQDNFINPYSNAQSSFTELEERRSSIPQLFMYANEDGMINGVNTLLEKMTKELQCKPNEIAIISFDPKYKKTAWVEEFANIHSKTISIIDRGQVPKSGNYVFATPYDINGLEFAGVILLGVDEGRVPQTAGTNDISQHFIRYSAYNMLYLSASRAKYKLYIMGNKLNGISSCLNYALEGGKLKEMDT